MRYIKASVLLGSVLALGGCAVDAASGEAEQLGSAEQALASVKYTVDTSGDFANGSCVANGNSAGQCTLRAAIAAAQAHTGEVIVELLADPVVSQGQISISGDAQPQITIQSQIPDGRRASITGSKNSRLFSIGSGASVVLYNLSIQAFSVSGLGGAVENNGDLEVQKSVFANNSSSCSASGVMSATVNCGGGAIWNSGSLTVSGGSRFENNRVNAVASTAAYVTASAGGGAIGSGGTLEINRPVAFVSNSVSAEATMGYRPTLPGGAVATASGGALSAYGSFSLVGTASCDFLSNSAIATASALDPNPSTATSQGGAISVSGGSIDTTGCTFAGNSAVVDPNVHQQ